MTNYLKSWCKEKGKRECVYRGGEDYRDQATLTKLKYEKVGKKFYTFHSQRSIREYENDG